MRYIKNLEVGLKQHATFKNILLYFGIFFLVILLGSIFVFNVNINPTNVTGARYFLSALIQSQAAIIAIIISLSLIVIQINSSNSIRLISSLKKNSDLWILLFLYLFAISVELYALKEFSGDTGNLSETGSKIASILYFVALSTFIILFPYAYHMLDLISPRKIVERLIQEIKIADFISESDRFLSLFDLTNKSIKESDHSTLNYMLNSITALFEITFKENLQENDKNQLCQHLTHQLKKQGRYCLLEKNEECLAEIIDCFGRCGIICVKKHSNENAKIFVEDILFFIPPSLENHSDLVLSQICESLGDTSIAETSRRSHVVLPKEGEEGWSSTDELGDISISTLGWYDEIIIRTRENQEEYYQTISTIASLLSKICSCSINSGFQTQSILNTLEGLVNSSIDSSNSSSFLKSLTSIKEILNASYFEGVETEHCGIKLDTFHAIFKLIDSITIRVFNIFGELEIFRLFSIIDNIATTSKDDPLGRDATQMGVQYFLKYGAYALKNKSEIRHDIATLLGGICAFNEDLVRYTIKQILEANPAFAEESEDFIRFSYNECERLKRVIKMREQMKTPNVKPKLYNLKT